MTRFTAIAAAVALLSSHGSAPAEGGSAIAPGEVVIEDYAVETSLTGQAGDPVAGELAFVDRGLGNCLACHAVSAIEDAQFPGNVGPSLDGVASRWSEGELRAILVDAKAIFSDSTVMPGFYTLDVGAYVREDLVGRTILTAQEVEDIVEFLRTLDE